MGIVRGKDEMIVMETELLVFVGVGVGSSLGNTIFSTSRSDGTEGEGG